MTIKTDKHNKNKPGVLEKGLLSEREDDSVIGMGNKLCRLIKEFKILCDEAHKRK